MSRPGLAMIAGALAVELMVSILQHPEGYVLHHLDKHPINPNRLNPCSFRNFAIQDFCIRNYSMLKIVVCSLVFSKRLNILLKIYYIYSYANRFLSISNYCLAIILRTVMNAYKSCTHHK